MMELKPHAKLISKAKGMKEEKGKRGKGERLHHAGMHLAAPGFGKRSPAKSPEPGRHSEERQRLKQSEKIADGRFYGFT